MCKAVNVLFKNEVVPETKYMIRKYFPFQDEDIKKTSILSEM